MRKATISQFILKARAVHGGLYDYSSTIYSGTHSPMQIVCQEHGPFSQTPHNHLKGSRCPKCALEISRASKTGKKKGPLTEEHKARLRDAYAQRIHNTTSRDSVKELFNMGLRVSEMAKKLHLNPVTVRYHLARIKADYQDVLQSSDRILRFDQWSSRASAKFSDRFTYDRDSFINVLKSTSITCPVHGVFQQTPQRHLRSNTGCPKCSSERAWISLLLPQDVFFERARAKFSDKFEYLSQYEGRFKTLVIKCLRHNHIFEQNAGVHLNSTYACPVCEDENKVKVGLKAWLTDCQHVHSGFYDYSRVIKLDSLQDKVLIICPKHGEFLQEAGSHRSGSACKICSGRKATLTTFLEKAKSAHKEDKYAYDKVSWVSMETPVEILCNTCHKTFWQKPTYHASGSGCPACALKYSKPQMEVVEYIKSLGIDVVVNDRKVLHPLEIDAFIPSKQLGVELHGVFWHQEKIKGKGYHQEKWKRAKEAGIKLIQIFEDEWCNKREVVKAVIAHKLGCSPGPAVFARKCAVGRITPEEGRVFLNQHHMHGAGISPVCYGLRFEGVLKAVLSFSKPPATGGAVTTQWVISRFTTVSSVVGGFSKLLSAFIREFTPESIGTYADLRFGDGEVYLNNGFKFSHYTVPSYAYILHHTLGGKSSFKRYHRFNFRKDRLKKIIGESFDPAKTEKQLTDEMGLWPVYDAGNAYYTWYSHTS